MAKTIIALENNTWRVGKMGPDRDGVKVRPGQPVCFDDDAEADYFVQAVDAEGQRRAVTEEEWAQLVAEHNAANGGAPEGGAGNDTSAGGDDTAAGGSGDDTGEPPVTTAKPKGKAKK